MTWLRSGLLLVVALIVCGCRPPHRNAAELLASAESLARVSRFEAARAGAAADTAAGNALARWVLPEYLNEVSGLALTGDGRLFTHGDEGGQVSEIDYRSGVLVKHFNVGNETARVDFEGITVAGDALFMIVSSGDLYEFREGAHGERVAYKVHKTGLAKTCEFEGVAYDARTESLLLACKNVLEKELKQSLVIFRWKLHGDSSGGGRLSRLTVPLASLMAALDSKTVRPSDIAVDPHSGNYVLVASQEKALLEITPSGEVIFVGLMPGEHEQAEGVAITRDSVLIISDEAVSARAIVTLYRRR